MKPLTLEQRVATLEGRVSELEHEVSGLKEENKGLKKELKDLWDYVIKLNKHFESCWNGLKAIFQRDHRPYKTAFNAMQEAKAEFPEVFSHIKEI